MGKMVVKEEVERDEVEDVSGKTRVYSPEVIKVQEQNVGFGKESG